jgi:hypothetical protein
VTPTGVEAKPRDSANWPLPLLIAVGSLELLIAVRFAYCRWSRRRSLRRGAENFARARSENVPKEGSYARNRSAKRWRQE